MWNTLVRLCNFQRFMLLVSRSVDGGLFYAWKLDVGHTMDLQEYLFYKPWLSLLYASATTSSHSI